MRFPQSVAGSLREIRSFPGGTGIAEVGGGLPVRDLPNRSPAAPLAGVAAGLRRHGFGAALATTALVASLGLALTLGMVASAVHVAGDAIALGECEAMVHRVAEDLRSSYGPPDADLVRRIARAHERQGLRYLAFRRPDGSLGAEAGRAELAQAARPSALARHGSRARLARPLPALFGPPSSPRPMRGRHPRAMHAPPTLVVEVETPVLASLEAAVLHAEIVGGIAVLLVLGSAVLLLRAARTRIALERKLEQGRRLAALGEMSAVMAHELRNPLAALKGHAQLLGEEVPPDSRVKTRVERIVSAAERLERLVTELLELVRNGPLAEDAIAPAELVRRSIGDEELERVRVDTHAAPGILRLDAARISRALGNVIRNALQASPEEASVHVAVRRDGAGVVFEVRDTGPGLPAGDEERIFEPFVTHRVRGTGLGLAIARRAVEQHGGTLVGRTLPEGGASFRFEIPGVAS